MKINTNQIVSISEANRYVCTAHISGDQRHKIRPTSRDVARVGLAVAAGTMKYEDLLNWILENK